jgi:hypothetical protein
VKRTAAVLFGIGLLLSTLGAVAFAGPPLNNLEGVGGIAFNPLAYTAGTPSSKDSTFPLKDILSKPQIGAWYVSLTQGGPKGVDWTSVGIAETLFKRFEVSYGYENVNLDSVKNIHKNSVGGKLLLLEENFKGLNFLPAISVGAIYKQTSGAGLYNFDSSGWDYYLVATKLITQLPKPVLLSAGAISTKAVATGVLGFGKDRDTTFFGNIDILPISQLALGFEYKHGADLKNVKNANYYDIHAAWFANQSLTLVLAYVNAGSSTSTSKVGLGDGLVLSAQYQF